MLFTRDSQPKSPALDRSLPVLACLILASVWFAIGTTSFLSRGLPQMLTEWRTYAPIKGNLEKRNLMFPGWADCVRLVKERVPAGSELVFVSDLEDERYSYLHLLLNYEIYPLRNFHRIVFLNGGRPPLVLIYPKRAANAAFKNYRKTYESSQAALLERVQ